MKYIGPFIIYYSTTCSHNVFQSDIIVYDQIFVKLLLLLKISHTQVWSFSL